MRTIHRAPDEMMTEIKPKNHQFKAKYPWRQVKTGEGFTVGVDEIGSLKSLNNYAYRMGKKLGVVFKVKYYSEHKSYFVANVGVRAPDPQALEKNAPAASSANPRPIPAATIRQPEEDPLSWLNKPLTDQPAATVHAGWPDPYKPVEDKPSVGTDQPFVAPWVRNDK